MTGPGPMERAVAEETILRVSEHLGSPCVTIVRYADEAYLIRNEREPTMSTRTARAVALHAAADEQDDARDHDEYHAAADVVLQGVTSPYVDRWVAGLEEAEERRQRTAKR